MIYRNTLTGIEFESDCICSGKNLELVETEAKKAEAEPMPKKSKGTKKK